MNYHYVFCHGFTFDKSYWNKILPHFKNEKCSFLDLGYFGNVQMDFTDTDEVLIGIGHSLGFTKLLSHKKKFHYYIGLNGFTNFLGSNEVLKKRRRKELQFLKALFNSNCEAEFIRFQKRCGLDSPLELQKKIYIDRLIHDLNLLEKNYCIPNDVPTLIFGARDDIIVPEALIIDNFTSMPNVRVQFFDSGQHALGIYHTEKIAEMIKEFIYGKSQFQIEGIRCVSS